MEEQQKNKFEAIEQKLAERRDYWMKWCSEMNEALRNMDTLVNLQATVYIKRQEALENYHSLAATLAKRSTL